MRILWKKYKRMHIDLNLDECGIQKCTPINNYRYTVTTPYIIHVVKDGEGFVDIDGVNVKLKAGDAFIMKRGMNVTYYPEFTNPWEYCWVGFSGVLADTYLSQLDFSVNFAYHLINHDLLDSMVSFTDALAEGDEDNELYRLKCLYEIFYKLSDFLFQKDQLRSGNNLNPYLESALDFINEHYVEQIKITDICKTLCITRSHLYRLFIANLNTSPREYLIQLRLLRAYELLRSTSLSIKEIARAAGYTDQLYFSAQFKQKFGCSPKAFRQALKDVDEAQ